MSRGRKATGLEPNFQLAGLPTLQLIQGESASPETQEVSELMRIRSVFKHSGQAVLEGALVSLLVVGLMAGTAFAAKGGGSRPSGGGGGGTLGLVLLDSTDGVAHYGQRITFQVSTTATSQPSVKVQCLQGGTSVYRSSAGFYPDYPWPWAQTFTLSSSAWIGGAADCTATLYYFNGKSYPTLATLDFHVAA